MRRLYYIRICHRLVASSWISLAMATVLTAAVPSIADISFPYTATVVTAEAAVQSGPGNDFYSTANLAEGSTVEVYRHDADGWCAIRPPSNSFSWIAAEHLELTDNPSLGRVINVPVKTRIGSAFSDIHDVEYISLRKGEIVQLLGSKTLREASGELPRRWFKIAPPAGEFRWVHAKSIRPIQKADERETEVGIEPIRTFDLADDAQKSLVNRAIESSDNRNRDPAFVDISQQVLPVNYEQDVARVPTKAESVPPPIAAQIDHAVVGVPSDTSTTSLQSTHVNAVTWEAVGSPADVLSAPEPRSFRDRYNALNVLLSRAVLQNIELWQLDKVIDQARLLLEYAQSVDEERLATTLLAKANEFQQLQQRSIRIQAGDSVDELVIQQTNHDDNDTAALPAQLPEFDADAVVAEVPEMPKLVRTAKRASKRMTGAGLQPTDQVDNSIFDASGVLVAVQSRRADMPRYALTDGGGQITRFVSVDHAASSLDQFINERVGIIGRVGLLRRLNKPHIVATRVVALQQH